MTLYINDSKKYEKLLTVSNPEKVLYNAIKYFNDPNIKLFVSGSKENKYMLYNDRMTKVNFGSIRYEDFTKHNDLKRRDRYLKRANNIRGHWEDDKNSANNLSINLLWN